MFDILRPRWHVVVILVGSGRVLEDVDTFYTYRRATHHCNAMNGWLWRRKELTTIRAIVHDRFPHRNLPRL